MKFETKYLDAGGRIGSVTHNDKQMITPNLFPVVSPFENIIPPQEIIDTFGGSAVFTNAYILYNNQEKAQIAKDIGVHKFINFNGFIATDSGAFQHYMYGNENDISPDEIELFQEEICSDFPVILDLPVQLDDNRETADYKVKETIKRAKFNIKRRKNKSCAWFGPIHGGKFLDIEKYSTIEMSKLDYGIYAIGGVVKTFNDYMFDISTNIILTVKRYLRADRPLHIFGLGLPQFFSLAVACGADTFDSAAYILFAKMGRYFTLEGTRQINELTELPCNCPICTKYSAKEIQEFFGDISGRKNKNLGVELLARHNLYVSFAELKNIRESIRNGNLWELVEQRVHAHPKLIQAYRNIPKYWKYLESLEPTDKHKATFIFGEISNSRPIFYRIFNKIRNNYKIDELKDIILIPELETSIHNSPTVQNLITESLKNSAENKPEILFISNMFGIIPYSIIDYYPLVQRAWNLKYLRTNKEIKSLLSYQNIEFNQYFWQPMQEKERQVKLRNNSEEFLFDMDRIVEYSDIIDRIEFVIEFLKSNSENINSIKIYRPFNYITEDRTNLELKIHLIDDIIQILSKEKKLFGKEIPIEIVSKFEAHTD